MKESDSFKKTFIENSDHYQASMYQQYEWSQAIDAADTTNKKLGMLLLFNVECKIVNPGDDISFGNGNKMSIMQILRLLREQPFYYGAKDDQELGVRIGFLIPKLQYYLGFIPLNETSLTDPFKTLCINFMKIKPIAADQDIDSHYIKYKKSLTYAPWEKYEAQKTYSVGLLNALQQMHAANMEKEKRAKERKQASSQSSSAGTSRPPSTDSEPASNNSGTKSSQHNDDNNEDYNDFNDNSDSLLVQALELASLLPQEEFIIISNSKKGHGRYYPSLKTAFIMTANDKKIEYTNVFARKYNPGLEGPSRDPETGDIVYIGSYRDPDYNAEKAMHRMDYTGSSGVYGKLMPS